MRERRCGKAEAVLYEDDPKIPYDDAEARWKYITMLLFNIKENLYTYHHVSNPSGRWMTFENLAKFHAFMMLEEKIFLEYKTRYGLFGHCLTWCGKQESQIFSKDDQSTDWLAN